MKTKLTTQDWALCIGHKLIIDGGDSYIIEEVGRGHLHLKGLNNMKVVPTFCKPILRTLDQMTEEEKNEFEKECVKISSLNESYYITFYGDIIYYSVHQIDWLTRKGFDIRGWIEAGLAIKEAYNDTK